jgi:hypothetical protein
LPGPRSSYLQPLCSCALRRVPPHLAFWLR